MVNLFQKVLKFLSVTHFLLLRALVVEVAAVQVDLVLVQPKVSKAMRCVHKMHTSFFNRTFKIE